LYKKFGINLDTSQGNENQELPIAATYVVEQDGTISYHFLEEDYKLRADPQEILEAL
jgi:peroxiredoxin